MRLLIERDIVVEAIEKAVDEVGKFDAGEAIYFNVIAYYRHHWMYPRHRHVYC